jgi:hypothetical protein
LLPAISAPAGGAVPPELISGLPPPTGELPENQVAPTAAETAPPEPPAAAPPLPRPRKRPASPAPPAQTSQAPPLVKF